MMRIGVPRVGGAPINPFMGHFKTLDGRVISLFIMVPDHYIRDTFEHLGLTEAANDPRFADSKGLAEHSEEVSDLVAKAFASQTYDYWREHLKTMKGQWAAVQSLLDLGADEQAIANDAFFAVEPIDAENPLLALDNVVVGPHRAWLTPETLERSLGVAFENCRRVRDGEPLLHEVVGRRR